MNRGRKKCVYEFGDFASVLDTLELTGDYKTRTNWQSIREHLGGKAANLFMMKAIGIPVPPGFTIPTTVCRSFHEWKRDNPRVNDNDFFDTAYGNQVWQEVLSCIKSIEGTFGRAFGSHDDPVLLSVRSGAAASMPGMMDTILNVGLSYQGVFNNDSPMGRSFADCLARLIQIYATTVRGDEAEPYNDIFASFCQSKNRSEVTVEAWKTICEQYQKTFAESNGFSFPSSPIHQLKESILAVFRSWMSSRAITYRKRIGVSDEAGTAVTIQTMVFGNRNDQSATGVIFTRNPSTGEPGLFGDYLVNAQGEDVVAGIRTPKSIREFGTWNETIAAELLELCNILELKFRFMQDIEFTVEDGRLWILQTRNGKATAEANVRVVLDLISEKVISEEEGLLQLKCEDFNQLLHPVFDVAAEDAVEPIAVGLNASPGCGVGAICFTAKEALEFRNDTIDCILVREETDAEDIEGMLASKGTLTLHGGATSHAAVVCRQFGIPAVCGAKGVKIVDKSELHCASGILRSGDILSINGTTGRVYSGSIPVVQSISGAGNLVESVVKLARKYSPINVKANADTAEDTRTALSMGAQGVGLCRTEHMFFGEDRIGDMKKAILAVPGSKDESELLARLQAAQTKDFSEILRVLNGLPFRVRLLDPPLHEFLPSLAYLRLKSLGLKIAGMPTEMLKAIDAEVQQVENLTETNPMLGFRGCRVAILRPQFLDMQCRALFGAMNTTLTLSQVDIMIPVVSLTDEARLLRQRIDALAAAEFPACRYRVGCMIELPRACLVADDLADPEKGGMEFFSFGTNDLTQTTLGISRDDAERHFLNSYVDSHIFDESPFVKLDKDGVGALMEIAVAKGRKARPGIDISVCGEHGGDELSIGIIHGMGIRGVSCSAFRCPIAVLAGAQAAINSDNSQNHEVARI